MKNEKTEKKYKGVKHCHAYHMMGDKKVALGEILNSLQKAQLI